MAWELLFKSDIGLMSLAVIVVTVVIAGGYIAYFTKKMDEKPAEK
jgi:hypothetical protein